MKLNTFCYALLALLALALVASLWFLHPVWMWLLFVNVLTLLIYGADKFAAGKNWQRVPELTLLVYGLVGGWLGAIVGQQLFRHKTQKQPFKTYFMISVVLNIAVTIGIGYWVYQRGAI